MTKIRMESKATIIVSSKSSMADEKMKISLQGLVPYAHVTLKMDVTTDQGRPFISFARFKADSTGCVDLSRDQSYGGTYNGIDQMGLFWSLEPHREIAQRYPRYHIMDVTEPMKFSLSLYNIDVTSVEDLDQLQSDGKLEEFELDSCEFERLYVKADVTIEEKTYEEDGFTGTLYLPPGEGPHPGVIVLFGGFPGLLQFKASLLASRGFAAFAPVFHGLLSNHEDAGDLNYLKNAVDFMVGHPKIISSGVGLLSNSFSAHLALLMATHMDHVKCVICKNGTVHNVGISYRLGDKTIEGLDSGFKSNFQRLFVKGEGILDLSVVFHAIPLTELLKQKGLIPFYNKKDVAFMYIAGLGDECVPAGHYADLFKILLEDAQHPNYEVHKYVGAGHLLEPPFAPLNKITNMANRPIKWGGSTVPHAIAQEDSWRRQIHFLRKNIVGSPKPRSGLNNTMPVKGWLTRSFSLVRKTLKMF